MVGDGSIQTLRLPLLLLPLVRRPRLEGKGVNALVYHKPPFLQQGVHHPMALDERHPLELRRDEQHLELGPRGAAGVVGDLAGISLEVVPAHIPNLIRDARH